MQSTQEIIERSQVPGPQPVMGQPTVGPSGAAASGMPDWVPGQYANMFVKYGAMYGVDPLRLAAMGKVESINFLPSVISGERRSPAGAMGMMQFMPGTWNAVAGQLGLDNPFDPEQSIQASAYYMSALYAGLPESRRSWDWASAAYNAGPGRVASVSGFNQLPGETQLYLRRIEESMGGYGRLNPRVSLSDHLRGSYDASRNGVLISDRLRGPYDASRNGVSIPGQPPSGPSSAGSGGMYYYYDLEMVDPRKRGFDFSVKSMRRSDGALIEYDDEGRSYVNGVLQSGGAYSGPSDAVTAATGVLEATSVPVATGVLEATSVPVATGVPVATASIFDESLITQYFGANYDTYMANFDQPGHTGVDYGVPTGTPIPATAAGTVGYAGWDANFGNYVRLDHGDGLQTYYAHLSGLGVKSGQKVGAGDVLGLSGDTGYSSGPHLHYEVRLNGVALNPLALPAGSAVGGPDLAGNSEDGKTSKGAKNDTNPGPAGADNLEIVPGIGGPMERALYAAGIFTFEQMANASIEQLNAVDGVGEKRAKDLKAAATGYIQTGSFPLTEAQQKAQSKNPTPDGYYNFEGNDQFDRIGPALEQRLYDAGISDLHSLANASVELLDGLDGVSAELAGEWISVAKALLALEGKGQDPKDTLFRPPAAPAAKDTGGGRVEEMYDTMEDEVWDFFYDELTGETRSR
jgi:predicted flap endonuclease-1-like 5' DNA nuclease